MKSPGRFLRTALVGALFVLLPVVLVVHLLAKVYQVAVALIGPLVHRLDENVHPAFPILIALLALVLVCFACGLLVRVKPARKAGAWLEKHFLSAIPGYKAMRALVRNFVGEKDGQSFRPVLYNSPEGHQEFAYVVEEHEDGHTTVMLPSAPTPLTGSVRIVRSDQLQPVECSLGEVTRVMSNWGVGARELMARHARPVRPDSTAPLGGVAPRPA